MKKTYEELYPGFSADAYKEMRRLRSGPLAKNKRRAAIEMFTKGITKEAICKALRCSLSALSIAEKHCPDFEQMWREAIHYRQSQVDERLLEMALKGTKEVRIVEVPLRDAEGVVYDNSGHIKWVPKERITTERPANVDAITFLLRLKEKQGHTGEPSMAPGDMKKVIEAKRKKDQPPEQNTDIKIV